MASGKLALWLCNGFATCLILAVFGLRKWRKLAFTMSDCWLAVALAFNAMRMVGDYHIDKYGTPLSYSVYLATLSPEEAASLDLEVTPDEANGLVLTGKLLIPTRVSITVVIWSLNMAVLDLLRTTLLRKCENKQQLFWSIYTVLALTFFVTILAAFIECQPLRLNWMLLPDVVKCSFGTAWIMTYEISNITIDYTIGFILIFLLFKRKTPKQERLKLSILGLWVIWGIVVMIRVIQGESFIDILQNRIGWGSVEVLFATSVATLPIIYILLRPVPQDMEHDVEKEIGGGSEGSTTVITLVGEASHPGDWQLQQGVGWNNPGVWGASIPRPGGVETMGTERTSVYGKVCKPMQQSSAFNPPPGRVGDRNSWQALRDTLRHSRPGSRVSLGMQETEDDPHEALAGWIELHEMNSSPQAREASSPEPEDGGRDGGIFVATEIHQAFEDAHRPRIITIPRRARLNRRAA